MEEKNFLELLSEHMKMQSLIELNQKTEQFGLALTEADTKMLLEMRKHELREQQRVEFGEGILPKLIYAFCDSDYISQYTYVDTIMRLQEIFYLYKNETGDEISDDELLQFMREQYEETCFGDLDYLESTCLQNFAKAIRAGETLTELCWR